MDHDSEAGWTTRRRLKLTDTPLKITAIYAVIGGLWILFSDQLLAALVSDPVTFTRLGMLKGWFYVIATAGLLYVLIWCRIEGRNEACVSLSPMINGQRARG